MPKARNQVIAGDFKGKEVKYTQRRIWISGFLRDITLNGNTVASYDLINKETKKDRAGAIRSGLVFGAGGLFAHAALSDDIGIYSVAIQFKDGKSCLIEIDASAYQTLNKTCFRTAFAEPDPIPQPIPQPLPVQPTASIPIPVAPSIPSDGSFFCSNCGNRVPSGSKFCNACGSSIIPPGVLSQPVEIEKPEPESPKESDVSQTAEPTMEICEEESALSLESEQVDTPHENEQIEESTEAMQAEIPSEGEPIEEPDTVEENETQNVPLDDTSILVIDGKTFNLAQIYDEAKGKKFWMTAKIEESFTMKQIMQRSEEEQKRISNAIKEYIKFRKGKE